MSISKPAEIQKNGELDSKPHSLKPSLPLPRPDGHGIGLFPASPEPIKFSWLLVKEICQRIQKGEFLTDILKEQRMPQHHTFQQWCEKKPKIGQWVERSRRVASNVLAEKSVTLFFEEPVKEVLTTKNGSYERISMSGVQRERYKSQAMQWLAAKWGSELYGDKLNVTNTLDLTAVLNSVHGSKMAKKLKRVQESTPVIETPQKPNV